MDVEKTIEFLLKSQAQADARFNAKFDRADERFRQWEIRFQKTEQRLDRLERVVAQNNRIVARLAGYDVSLRSDIRRLTQAQAVTDRTLMAFIQSSTRRNGGR